jgi:hypothetical protein
MLRRTYALVSIAFALFLFAATGAAATIQRTFVASTGNDANTCSIAAPCRGFPRAITQTSAGGEVIVLDSAGYGAVTITKSVSIIASPGTYAGISVFSGDGVTVAAGPTDKVVLRGLTINGQGGTNGIRVTSGKETHIEDCTVSNLTQKGILVEGGAAVHILRSVVRSNGLQGVLVQPSAAIAIVTTLTDSVLASNLGEGYAASTPIAGSTIDAAIAHVTASGNAEGFGAFTVGVSAGTVNLAISDSTASENNVGVDAFGANATVSVSGTSFVRNSAADLEQSNGAVLLTAGNNAVTGRPGDVSGTLTSNPLK